ncbi:protein of unknown function (DUF4158) (plasmid) [Xanthomonas citri pv. citri]|uniref:Transposase n=2 Tax=Xanthomonas citri pv. citri TaxID=611301 RepID=A0AAI7ZJC7_XANAC|nr:transposase [Xanthomonas citri pv. citri str. 306]AGH79942.1 transposase [Xanthomonas axonopodis Xac29-1]AGI10531.1 Transposase [Xanthomonas citri subsp. citri Aw12879]AJD66501.1 hypothetical protein J151_00029 [Xanthomonas citri subsp. citri A306]AJY80040.1 protein of unknown function (DUF4158) [Xanthomonas citri pv. citri]AJY84462.1 protein of unknown function (DUF4158) [Xanthomonas citri subsp. citri UI6]QYF47348.1 transposase [Xanthomonas citri]
MGNKNKLLTVLSDAEQEALYGLPDFDDAQRLEYLALSEAELARTSNARRSPNMSTTPSASASPNGSAIGSGQPIFCRNSRSRPPRSRAAT